AVLARLVACGGFAIQTGIGGEAINAMIIALLPAWKTFSLAVPVCFAFFWLLNVLVIVRGIKTIRFLQGISAPFLLLIGLALLLWARGDRKSTRLNSSHGSISYAVFCLHKKT